jgi:BCD family chlorophyll transporter-like MFS transporter
MLGLLAFSAVIFAEPFQSAVLFGIGTMLIGLGGALFGVGTLMASVGMASAGMASACGAPVGQNGLALGAFGAAQASAAGLAIALGGIIRDVVDQLATSGALGEALSGPAVGYSVVYHIEIYLLFATLVALGPLVRLRPVAVPFSLAEASD